MLRFKGENYVNNKGAVVQAKEFKDFSGKCQYYSGSKVSREDKQKFHELYYNSESWETQTALIAGDVKCRNVERRRSGNKDKSKKQVSRTSYTPTSDGDMMVCKNMFAGKLQIDSARIHRSLPELKSSKTSDLRGNHVPHNKIPSATTYLIHTHIENFRTTTSPYATSQTNITYLGTNLNISLMYQLFIEDLNEKSLLEKILSQSMYQKVFRRDFY
ncbi:hypothetical protein PR048_007403 [Dryococelus australis]|uniref:Uncharacterized protein n=1 Tax=Dryococelus australis TaxID=614101 RepID=A0ABQ9HV29_9NEOP|nr:hypothetical protein PR048_007403 [Dryococelus australis]